MIPLRRLDELIATFFYVGKFPFAPGTAGSFAGLLLFLSVLDKPALQVLLFVLLTALGFFSAGRAERIFGKKDPKPVVIDEVAGIFIAFFGIPAHGLVFLSGFLLYRLLDIIKPFPARRLERLEGSAGIMLDDLLCAVYTNLILRALVLFLKV